MTTFIDIETIPLDSPEIMAEIAASITPPGNMSKAETIAAWEAEKKPGLVEEKFRMGGLSAVTGKIVCVGVIIGRDEVTFYGDDEKEILLDSLEYVSANTQHNMGPLVGHNITGFDIPFIRQRCIVHGIRPGEVIRKAWSAKPWDQQYVHDTMLMWSPDREKRISLDKLCRLLGIPSPKADGMDGSRVYDLWRSGQHEQVAEYCLRDIRATAAVYERMRVVM